MQLRDHDAVVGKVAARIVTGCDYPNCDCPDKAAEVEAALRSLAEPSAEVIEAMARAMEPSAFETYGRGHTVRNYIAERAFLNAKATVKRARKKARAAHAALFKHLLGEG